MNTGFLVVLVVVIILSALLSAGISLFIVWKKKKRILSKAEELIASVKGGLQTNANTRTTAIDAIKAAHYGEERKESGKGPVGGNSEVTTGTNNPINNTNQSDGLPQQPGQRERIPIRAAEPVRKSKKRIRIHKPLALRSEQDYE